MQSSASAANAIAVPPSPNVMVLRVRFPTAMFCPIRSRHHPGRTEISCTEQCWKTRSHSLIKIKTRGARAPASGLRLHNVPFAKPEPRFCATCLFFQCLEIGDHIADLVAVEAELRHVLVTGADVFRERLLQALDRIAQMQRAERRRDLQRALARLVDRMTPRAVRANEIQSALNALRLGAAGGDRPEQQRGNKQALHGCDLVVLAPCPSSPGRRNHEFSR